MARFALIAAIWAVAIAGGMYYLLRYSSISGEAAAAPKEWPGISQIQRSTSTPTLVFFGHSRCPCSMASVGELNEIMAKVAKPIKVYAVFVLPKDADQKWRESSLIKDAKNIRGVDTVLDVGGVIARQFQAKTSGQTMLYSNTGQLVFSGGITAARGHSGDNRGKSAVISYVNDKKIETQVTPVFGCTLYQEHKHEPL